MPEAVVLTMPGLPATEAPVELTPRQKAAVLVLQLGREACAPVLAELTERELELLSTEVAQIGDVDPRLAAEVLEEFAITLTSDSPALRGGMDAARGLLHASISPDRAVAISQRVSKNFVGAPFAFLQKLDARQVVSFLSEEHPQTIYRWANEPKELWLLPGTGHGTDLLSPAFSRRLLDELDRRLR